MATYRIDFHGFAFVEAESEEDARAEFYNDGESYAEYTIEDMTEDD